VTARLAAAVIARDEEVQLPGCLDSLAWAEVRLVLVDDRTTDRTAKVARARGALVECHRFQSFPQQRNAVLERLARLATVDWVLFVDADERATPALAAEIRQAMGRSDAAAAVGYWIPRRNFIWGDWVRHGGWSPDFQLRLLRIDRCRYDEGRDVHEVVKVDGPTGRLTEALIHYNYDRLDQFLAKQRQYASLEARRLSRLGIGTRPHNFVLQPLREFRRRYVELEGYRDGWRGLALASLLAWYTIVTYGHLARQKAHS
jgi:glycosyltransferase involved in cell wall biosynthesis